MAKKLGKLVLFTAAVGTIAAAAYLAYKNTEEALAKLNDDDFDDFEDSGDVHTRKASGRKYVDLFNEDKEDEETKKDDKDFVPLSETVSEAVEKAADEVEEFFDEEDTSEDDFEEDFREEPADDTPEEGSEDL